MKTSFFLFIFFCVNLSYSQGDIILRGGKRIPYTKLKTRDYYTVTVVNGKSSRNVLSDSVYAMIPKDEGKIYYNKPNRTDGSLTFEWVELELDGPISLYNKEVSSRTGSTTYGFSNFNNLYLFAEKNREYHTLFVTGTIGQNKKEKEAILARLVGDDPECKAIIESPDFKYARQAIVTLVKRYNQNSIRRNQQLFHKDSARIVFFQRNSPFNAKVIIDGREFQIDSDNKISVKLPKKTFFSACIDSPASDCTIVSSDDVTKYYIILTNRDNQRTIQISNLRSARFTIKNLQE